MVAASTVHWLILLDTRFISASGAPAPRRAHVTVETISGNSDRNGATHWTRKNRLTPNSAAAASIDSRNGWAVSSRSAPPPPRRPAIAADRPQPRWRSAHRDTRGV